MRSERGWPAHSPANPLPSHGGRELKGCAPQWSSHGPGASKDPGVPPRAWAGRPWLGGACAVAPLGGLHNAGRARGPYAAQSRRADCCVGVYLLHGASHEGMHPAHSLQMPAMTATSPTKAYTATWIHPGTAHPGRPTTGHARVGRPNRRLWAAGGPTVRGSREAPCRARHWWLGAFGPQAASNYRWSTGPVSGTKCYGPWVWAAQW